jgi:arylsulfatase A-like enzyme
MKPLQLLAVSVVSLSLAAVGFLVHERQAPASVVIITLDTTRADRLSPYGFMNVSLPALERLAREGVVFDQAMSVGPLTLPAHTSLLTGLLPPHHGVRDNADSPLAGSHTTLAEVLRRSGFRTGAFVGSVVLDPDRGLDQGFEKYGAVDQAPDSRERRRQRPANEVVDDALGWMASVEDAPFFLWVHLYDAHRPYAPPEPYASTYSHNPYVGEIAFADAQLGRLLEALDRRRLLDRAVVVVAGDHGEALGERGEQDHGIFLYDNVLRVPLMVRAPSLPPARIGEVVRLTDVMPTVLDLLDLPSPATDGTSLVPLMHGRVADLDLEAYAESIYPERLGWSPLRALRVGRFKLIDAPRPELFDLARDPFEEKDIYEERRALGATMAARAKRIAAAGRVTPQDTTPELRERLNALGYLTRTRTKPIAGGERLPDPKDVIHLLQRR